MIRRNFLFMFLIAGNSLLLFSQSNPVSIDLRSNGVKLDAKISAAGKSKGFESDHRFSNMIDDISETIIDWIAKN